MLSQYNLAPPVLARFENGLIYRFIRGDACSPQDLGKECVWRGVARKMGEWHGILPVASLSDDEKNTTLPSSDLDVGQVVNSLSPYPVEPNIWTVMQKWITALPTPTPEDEDRKTTLQKELEWLVEELGNTKHLPSWSVSRHCPTNLALC
jgi:ethanolamine kinase